MSLFLSNQNKSWENLDNKSRKIVMSYVAFLDSSFLINKHIGEGDFPKISLKYKNSNSLVQNIIFEIQKKIDLRVFDFINKVKCKTIDFIFHSSLGVSQLNEIVIAVNNSNRVKQVKITCKYNENVNYQNILKSTSKISHLIIFGANEESYNKVGIVNLYKLTSNKLSGFEPLNKLEHMSVSLDFFVESQKHHTYFNRKLFIGKNGEIKNTPESEYVYENINSLKKPEELNEIIFSSEYQEHWYVHKEIVDICKDCEFRHMCTDNRLPFKRTENEWYHKTECDYNPYINKWKGEKGYVSLADCGVFSSEKSYSKDEKKISSINKELWD
jgi:SPASM domain peptide maturase of grasp-with-spasm system